MRAQTARVLLVCGLVTVSSTRSTAVAQSPALSVSRADRGFRTPLSEFGQYYPAPVGGPAWPCRLVIANDLRASVELAWERSPTFRAQCERLAEFGTLVLIHRATAVQTPRQAQTSIGTSSEGIMVARVLVRLNADTIELIAHELEHVLEQLQGVNLAKMADRHRTGVFSAGEAYETERAIEAGQRVAREVRDHS